MKSHGQLVKTRRKSIQKNHLNKNKLDMWTSLGNIKITLCPYLALGSRIKWNLFGKFLIIYHSCALYKLLQVGLTARMPVFNEKSYFSWKSLRFYFWFCLFALWLLSISSCHLETSQFAVAASSSSLNQIWQMDFRIFLSVISLASVEIGRRPPTMTLLKEMLPHELIPS